MMCADDTDHMHGNARGPEGSHLLLVTWEYLLSSDRNAHRRARGPDDRVVHRCGMACCCLRAHCNAHGCTHMIDIVVHTEVNIK